MLITSAIYTILNTYLASELILKPVINKTILQTLLNVPAPVLGDIALSSRPYEIIIIIIS